MIDIFDELKIWVDNLITNDIFEQFKVEINELIEELGWECDFEGESWKFETNGVYFIK